MQTDSSRIWTRVAGSTFRRYTKSTSKFMHTQSINSFRFLSISLLLISYGWSRVFGFFKQKFKSRHFLKAISLSLKTKITKSFSPWRFHRSTSFRGKSSFTHPLRSFVPPHITLHLFLRLLFLFSFILFFFFFFFFFCSTIFFCTYLCTIFIATPTPTFLLRLLPLRFIFFNALAYSLPLFFLLLFPSLSFFFLFL